MKGIKVASRKAKGRSLQQWVCEQISKVTGLPWGPDQPIASREMGQKGVDVRLVGKARKLFPFSVECKRQENWAIPTWIKQAQENEMTGTDWILFVRKNRQDPIVIMGADVFFAIYEDLLLLQKRKAK